MARCLIVAVCMSCYHYDMDEKDFALRLAQLREKKNVSAREMSLAIGQNPGYINNIELGKSLPSLPGVFYICDYLGILEEELHTVIYDIISKQAEVIFNTSSIGIVSASTLQAEQQVEIQAQLDTYKREKQSLYEKLMGKEITTVEYQVMKKTFDEKIAYAQQQLERCCKQIEENNITAKSNSELKKLAKDIKKENTLSQSLADGLIDKVYVYPNKRIEIVWKVQDFCTVQATV